ncbi:PASTA domain-containing protein [Pseudochryseolinea flava]|uniref:Penicillin-binding protein n=1 Tax=Pseudochryseolinea flava TaxID=2059302 RepID=A0A364XVB1_9BACT|nr:PASTA domain-containing protein [Pseudochryseolinea flava]RAV98061.1 penicillin-binding protein [Pseudochryseolinea flava]
MNIKFGKYNKDNLGGVLIHFFIAFAIMMTLVVIYFYAYLPSTTNHGETITVPDIEGATLEELEEKLIQKDLDYVIDDSSYSPDFKPLTVLKQYPKAGSKVKEGRKIYISINSVTPPSVPVPNLIDASVLNAEVVLKSNELKRGKITLVRGPFNIVKEMKFKGQPIHAGDRVPKGSVIDLVVMDGGLNEIGIENWVGQPVDDVLFTIRAKNLNLGEVIIVGGDTTGAVVLKQKPTAGENVKVGDNVDLWIGKEGTEVPEEEF